MGKISSARGPCKRLHHGAGSGGHFQMSGCGVCTSVQQGTRCPHQPAGCRVCRASTGRPVSMTGTVEHGVSEALALYIGDERLVGSFTYNEAVVREKLHETVIDDAKEMWKTKPPLRQFAPALWSTVEVALRVVLKDCQQGEMGAESAGAVTRDCKREKNAKRYNVQTATSTRSTSGKRDVSSILFRDVVLLIVRLGLCFVV